jgi:hypothetical protein
MSKNRIDDWSGIEGQQVEVGGIAILDDGRVYLSFTTGAWAMLKPTSLGISLTSHVSLGDEFVVGLISNDEYLAACNAEDARKASEQRKAEEENAAAMRARAERLR